MIGERSVPSFKHEAGHEDVRALLETVQAKGVRLWLEQEQLRFRAPVNALSERELQQLRHAKPQIIEVLKDSASGRANAAKTTDIEAPLAYSQLQHWNFYDLGNHPSRRHLAAVRRISGPLDPNVLERSVREIIDRQDSLRTRFVRRDGVAVQVICERSDWSLAVRELTHVPPEEIQATIQRAIDRIILEPVDVSSGPLFALELLRLGEQEHLLVLAMEHIISDMWSLGLFLRDLFEVYEQLVARKSASLARPPVQFAEYASWQRSQERSWIQQHAAYWQERLRGFGRDRIPRQMARSTAVAGWGMVPIDFGADLSRALIAGCRAQRTTIVMGVCALYAALVQRWLGREETILRFESNGRVSPGLQQTIGYFTVPLFLRCRLEREDTFAAYLHRLLAEYYTALERSDSSFVEAQLPRPEYSRNTSFNWIPNSASGEAGESNPSRSLSIREYAFENPFLRTLERDTEPFVLFGQDAMHTMSLESAEKQWATRSSVAKGGEQVVGAIYFPRADFSEVVMEMFAQDLVEMAEAVRGNPGAIISELALTSTHA